MILLNITTNDEKMIKNFLKMFALSIMLGCTIEGMESQEVIENFDQKKMQKVGGLQGIQKVGGLEKSEGPCKANPDRTVPYCVQHYKIANKEYASSDYDKKDCFLFHIWIAQKELFKQLFSKDQKVLKQFEEEMTNFEEKKLKKCNVAFDNAERKELKKLYIDFMNGSGKEFSVDLSEKLNKAFEEIVKNNNECQRFFDFLKTNENDLVYNKYKNKVDKYFSHELTGKNVSHSFGLSGEKNINIRFGLKQYIFPGDESKLCTKKCEFGRLKNTYVLSESHSNTLRKLFDEAKCNIEKRQNDIQEEMREQGVTSEKRACKKCILNFKNENAPAVNANRIQGNSEEESKDQFENVTVQKIKK